MYPGFILFAESRDASIWFKVKRKKKKERKKKMKEAGVYTREPAKRIQ